MAEALTMRWPPIAVISSQESIDELAALVEEVNQRGDAHKEAGWLARLLVVRSCGYLEQVVMSVSSEAIATRAGGVVKTFAHSWLPSSRNPAPEFLVQWVGRFDASWANELEEILDDGDEQMRRELSLLVDRRNRIAHGLNEGITVRKALDLKKTAASVADWFLVRFDPT
jgi:hypothetical protein